MFWEGKNVYTVVFKLLNFIFFRVFGVDLLVDDVVGALVNQDSLFDTEVFF